MCVGDGAVMMEVDHDVKQVLVDKLGLGVEAGAWGALPRAAAAVQHRLNNPIVTTYVDTDKISFERNKAGVWGWRSDKSEQVNGYHCKVFGASNVELVTKTRCEHLAEEDKVRARAPRTPLHGLLGMAADEPEQDQERAERPVVTAPTRPTPEMYFGSEPLEPGHDVGRPRDLSTKVQKFRATLWLCEQYPLSLQEQIMPVVDLMAISSTHFAKLKDFIQMQLPSGFPVKIEIPLFHVLNARITFGNIFALDEAVSGVTHSDEADRPVCVVDDACFAVPPGYARLHAAEDWDARHLPAATAEEEDDLLQFAIQQSLVEAGTEHEEVDIWEALRAQRPTTPLQVHDETWQLQR